MKRELLWLVACQLLTLFLIFGTPRHAIAEKAEYSLEEVIKGMEETYNRWKSLDSWMVHYHHVRERINPRPDMLTEYPPNEMINARKGKWFFARESQKQLKSLNPRAGPNDRVNSWIVWKGDVAVEREELHVSILPELGPRAYQCFFYTGWLFLDMQTDLEVRSASLKKLLHSGSHPSAEYDDLYMLPQCIIKHKSEYRVRPKREAVEGVECVVVERPNHDVIWIDPEIGFLIRRRRYCQPPGYLVADLTHYDFRNKAPGIWLPQRSKSIIYHPATAPESYRGKVVDIAQNILIEARFNDLPDEFFQVPIPDGATIHDYLRGFTYVKHPPQNDPVQSALARARTMFKGDPSRRRSWLSIVFAAGCGIQFLALGLLMHRLKKAKKKASSS